MIRRRQTTADALRGWLAGQSWSRVQRLIKTRHAMVDGNLCLDAGRWRSMRVEVADG